MPSPYSPYAIAGFFVTKSLETGIELTPMKLVKLVYLSHGWYLGLYGKPLIAEQVQAWKYGPVINSIYHGYKHYGSRQIESVVMSATSYTPLAENDIAFLQKIWSTYSEWNGLQLSTLTHESYSPWDQIFNKGEGNKKNGTPIPDEIIAQYYKNKVNEHASQPQQPA